MLFLGGVKLIFDFWCHYCLALDYLIYINTVEIKIIKVLSFTISASVSLSYLLHLQIFASLFILLLSAYAHFNEEKYRLAVYLMKSVAVSSNNILLNIIDVVCVAC